MKFSFLFFLVSFFLAEPSFPIDQYHKVRIYLDQTIDGQYLSRMGIDMESSHGKSGVYRDVIVSDGVMRQLDESGIAHTVQIRDLAHYYSNRLSRAPENIYTPGSMGGYYTYAEVAAKLDSLHSMAPSLVTEKLSIGTTYEGLDIYAVKVSDNPLVNEDEPELLLTGVHHAREPITVMLLLYYLQYLLENYGTDDGITYLIDNREIWIVPIVNPDGYVYNQLTNPSGGGMHRKNRFPNGCSGTGVGTDLNRNYGFMWGYDNIGSSPLPCSDTYRGSAPFSEGETLTLQDFVSQHDFKAAINYHSYSNLVLYPYSYDDSASVPYADSLIYAEYGNILSCLTNYPHGTAPGLLYPTNGDANDWMYGSGGIYAFTLEVGSQTDGFWPPADRILPLCEETLPTNIFITTIAGPAYCIDQHMLIEPDNWFPDPGEMFQVNVFIRNRGLSGSPGPLSIIPEYDSGIFTIADSMYMIPSLDPGETCSPGVTLDLTVESGIPPGTRSLLHLGIMDNSGYTQQDSIEIVIGTPDMAFTEDAEGDLSGWSTGSGWGLSNDAYSGDHSITDSPYGDYADQAENILTCLTPLDLSDLSLALLRFSTRWDIELNWDFAQVQISPNGGSTWHAVAGQRTSPGSGNGVQPEGSPGYHGTQQGWVTETMDFSPWIGYDNVRIRFVLMSDAYVTGDGWYLDDIALLTYPAVHASPGDVNQDGTVNVTDIVRLVNIILGYGEPPTGAETAAADMNQDGTLNVLDIVAIVYVILNN